jgi:hypothetical protein
LTASVAPRSSRSSATGTIARRREQRRGVEAHTRIVPRVAHPGRPHLAGELAMPLFAREDEHFGAHVSRDREDQVRRRAESE